MLLKWGIASCGGISGDFVQALSLLPANEHQVVAAAAANSMERAEIFLKEHSLQNNAAKAYKCYADLFRDTDVDIVYVGNIHPQHKDTVLEALKAGKHVLCEKPLGISSLEVKEMVEMAKKERKFLMEGFWSRCFPAYDHIKTELKDYLGEAKVVMADLGSLPTRPRHTEAELGASALLDPGCYLIQFALWVFGGERPHKVVAVGHLNEKGVDDSASITLSFSRNRLAQLYYARGIATNRDGIIYGSNGKFIKFPEKFWCPQKLETPDGTLEFPLAVPDKELKLTFPDSKGLVYEAQCVRDCIQKGLLECPKMTLDDSVLIAEVMDECRKQLYNTNL